ncbi:MAG: DHA2 family efflux MFS transporter permease subunit [Bradyrhizobium sp.]|nr:MAG: DHA2 family efflux MFS transporter permease subunit [Bradyrhizobium sp.]
MVAFDSLVVTTALSTIRRDLGAPMETLEWTVNAYSLSFAVLLLTGAALGERYGRRRLFVIGLFLFAAASAACALAGDADLLIAARVAQGAGAALVMPLAMALLSIAFPKEERARALGLFGGITGLALILGPVAGGAIAEGAPWQWIFWINVPVACVVIPLAMRRIDESCGVRAAPDVLGVALVTLGSLGLVWGLMRGNHVGWASAEVLTASAAGLLLLAAFVAWEMHTGEPMTPMRFFRSRAFASGVAASTLFYASMYGVLFILPQFFQNGQNLGPLAAGLRLLPWTATLVVAAPIAGGLVNAVGERRLVTIGLIMQALGMAWIAAVASPELAYIQLVPPLLLAGCGVSMAMPAAQHAVLSSVATSEIGKASGTFNMLRYLGGVFGVALVGALFAGRGNPASPKAFSNSFSLAIGACAALSLAGAIAGLWLPTRVALAKHVGRSKHGGAMQMADSIASRPGSALAGKGEQNNFTVAVVARFETEPGTDAEIQDFFSRGYAIVEQQPASTMWIAYRTGPTSFGAFAAFACEADRDALLSAGGPKMSREFAGLFVKPPSFEKADVFVARLCN